MTYDLLPGSLWRIPARTWDDDEDWSLTNVTPGNISISEDASSVYVEASLPGVDPKDVEVTFDKGVVWIKGETKTEEKGKKFFGNWEFKNGYNLKI